MYDVEILKKKKKKKKKKKNPDYYEIIYSSFHWVLLSLFYKH